jgi:hypothetical protein
MQAWSGMESALERTTERSLSAYGNARPSEAIDDFGLTTVMLTIAELDGSLVEHGADILEPSS